MTVFVYVTCYIMSSNDAARCDCGFVLCVGSASPHPFISTISRLYAASISLPESIQQNDNFIHRVPARIVSLTLSVIRFEIFYETTARMHMLLMCSGFLF